MNMFQQCIKFWQSSGTYPTWTGCL